MEHSKLQLSALALKRQLGVSYLTAWLLHHKINRAMTAHDCAQCLSGSVQLDDAYLDDERAGGKAGRGSENKGPFVAAVSLDGRGQPTSGCNLVNWWLNVGVTGLGFAC